MLFDIVMTIIALLALLIASYTDIKTREVPDWLNFGLIFAAIGIRVIFSTRFGYSLIIDGILGLAVGILLGYIFYYSRQWGGGDSKLLMGMGTVIGIPYPFANFNFLIFLAALLFFGAIWGVLWMGYVAVRNKYEFKNAFHAAMHDNKKLHVGLWLFTLLIVVVSFNNLLFLPFILFPIPFFYLFLFMTSVEKTSFITKISTHKLVEGDWLAKPVIHNGKTILLKKTLEKEDLRFLKKHHISSVMVKEGVPFVPGFLFGYLALKFFNFQWLAAFF